MKTKLTPVKRILFNAILLAIPIIFLLFAEGLLRFMDVGNDLPLFHTYHENSDLLVANSDVSLRYFSKKGMTGFGTVDSFWKNKKHDSKRIFVLGGSTTAGYPYFFNGGYPSMLKTQLESVYPNTDFEMINLGMTAVNSYTVRDLAKECLEYDPDLLIIYTGHNEFYGALGAGSTQGAFGKYLGGRPFILMLIQLKKWKLYQVVRSLVDKVKPTKIIKERGAETLMSQLAKEQEISWGSSLYWNTIDVFEKNVRDIILWGEERNVSVLIGTVASNVRDQKPYVSIHSSGVDVSSIEKTILNIRALMMKGEFKKALLEIRGAITIDPEYALLYFYAGRCNEYLKNYGEANLQYELARDYDGLRFRASSDINESIKVFNEYSNVYVSDIEGYLAESAKNGLIGYEFMLEHLHPNEKGNKLIAESFYKSIIDNNLLNMNMIGPSTKIEKYPVRMTQLDRTIADYRIKILTSGWPFSPNNRFITVAELQQYNMVDSIGVYMLQNKLSYWEAHIKMAEYYRKILDIGRAEREYLALISAFPNVWKCYKAIAEFYIEFELYDDALVYLIQATNLGGDSYCYKMAGSIFVQKKQPKEAIRYLEMACKLSPGDTQALYNLSGAYYLTGDLDSAKELLKMIIQDYPNYKQAKIFYSRIKE